MKKKCDCTCIHFTVRYTVCNTKWKIGTLLTKDIYCADHSSRVLAKGSK